MKQPISVVVAAGVAVTALFGQLPNIKPGWNLFSKQQDVQMGREAAAQIESQVRLVRDPQIEGYVREIGQRLAATPIARESGFPYSFKVVADKNINAFALPGGPTYVNTGLIAAADNEAQVAGVMAHEIGHVALRHSTNQVSKANAAQIPAMILGGVIGNRGMTGALAQLGLGFGVNSLLLKYSRDAEKQSDLLGAQMMAQAGYDPREMARFFEKLEAQGGSRGPQFLASHPNPGNRVRYVSEILPYLPRRDYATEQTGDFRQIRARLSSGQIATVGGPQQSSRPQAGGMRNFQGRGFQMAVPANWEVFGDNDSASVTIAPREGISRDSNGNAAIAYGVIVNYHYPQGDRIDLRRDTQELIRTLQQGNQSLRVRESGRTVSIGSQTGLVTTMTSDSPIRGELETDMLVTTARPEGLFYVLFIAPQDEMRQVQGTFEEMLRSLRFSS